MEAIRRDRPAVQAAGPPGAWAGPGALAPRPPGCEWPGQRGSCRSSGHPPQDHRRVRRCDSR